MWKIFHRGEEKENHHTEEVFSQWASLFMFLTFCLRRRSAFPPVGFYSFVFYFLFFRGFIRGLFSPYSLIPGWDIRMTDTRWLRYSGRRQRILAVTEEEVLRKDTPDLSRRGRGKIHRVFFLLILINTFRNDSRGRLQEPRISYGGPSGPGRLFRFPWQSRFFVERIQKDHHTEEAKPLQ